LQKIYIFVKCKIYIYNQIKFLVMKKITLGKGATLSVLALFLGMTKVSAQQTYDWVGNTNSSFYTASNWTSAQGAVVFDDASFKTVRTHDTPGSDPVIDQVIAWQPGIFDATGGTLTVNADFNCFFNDFLNGTVTVNSGATFTCRNIIRVGRAGMGTVNVNGTFRANNTDTWQGIFIGVVAGGNGTVNVNNGGVVNGGYHVEVGTRDFYPIGVLNVNAGGLSEAYWNTVVGPNATLNVNGGTVNTGQGLIIGDLYVDNAPNTGTLGAVVGTLNVNSGIITVNHNDLAEPNFSLHANSKVTIDNGTLRVMRTGTDFTTAMNDHITASRIVPATGKQLVVNYDGVYTTVTAEAVTAISDVTKNAFTVYPNPAQDVLTIQPGVNVAGDVQVKIADLLGKTVFQGTAAAINGYAINISNLSSGMYMVQVANGTAVSTTKIIKK
jgi:hypothetical protein